MEKKAFKTKFTLPPNVNGRCRGRLSLCLHEIKWHSEDPFQFNWIQAKLNWWGDKFNSGASLKLKNKKNLKKSFGHAIHYNILTKLSLFKSYLLSSEFVDVKFSSGISNIEIGKTNIPIPTDLIVFIDQKSVHSAQTTAKFRKRCQIFNSLDKIIGEILVDFEMLLYDRVLNETEMFDEISSNLYEQNIGIENNMNQFNSKSSLTKFKPTKTTKKYPKIKSTDKLCDVTKTCIEKIPVLSTKQLSIKSPSSSPLLNYLTGRPLGKMEECEAFKAMASTSPTESLIDLLSFDLNGLYLPKKTKDTEASILEKIDCLRVHIQDLCLTRAGTREILSKNTPNESSFSSGNFTVEIDIDTILVSKSPFEKNTTFTSKVARIFSSSVETCTPCIEFNRTSVHKLNAFCIKSRNSYINGVISMDIRYRDIGSSASHILGTARFHLADVVQATNFTFQQHCPVKITSNEIIVGRLSIKAELGCRGLHFGGDFLEAISLNSVEMSKQSLPCEYFSRHSQYAEHLDSYNGYQCHKFDHRNDDFYYDSCLYDIHDEQTEDKTGNPSAPLNLEGHTNNDQKINGNKLNNIVDEMSEKNLSHRLQNVDETSDDAEHGLKGLFHIGQINFCSWYQSTSDTFLVCRPFWIDSALVTECCQNKTKDENYQLNYLEVFSVICDQKLFESTKHGFMSIEVWQRTNNQTNSLIGSAKVPLHQFFIAFNNNSIRNHVSKQELPVISIDGWVTVANSSSPSSTPVGTVQAILAVGTTKQINNLKKSKNLVTCNSFLRFPLEMYPLQVNQPLPQQTPVTTVQNKLETTTKNALPTLVNERQNNLASMFSSFIDNLASRLPSERNLSATETSTNDATTQTNNATNNGVTANNNTGKYMRPTSELLDELQKALAMAPTPAQKSAIPHTPLPSREQIPNTEPNLAPNSKESAMFRVHIEIESALHLPSIAIHINKKGGKRNRNTTNSAKKTTNTSDSEPCTYATFEAAASNLPGNLSAYTTNIVENSCGPQWNKHFEVYLPVEYLQNDEKRFVIRVLRKVSDNTPKTRLIPSSSIDVTIGCASVDLSVLLAGLPSISGWFNIIDHSGCINGQIKIHIKPKDDLARYQKRGQPEMNMSNVSEAANQTQNSDQMDLNTTSNESRSADDSALSRALKRKFTELEEITQRLRARLFDVTGNMSIDPDDQFENDLNTIPDEDDDDFEESNIASEMSLDWLEHCHNQASSNESNDKSNHTDTSIAAQMRDIFDFLSPDLGAMQSTPTSETNDKQMENNEFFQNRLSNRFSDVLSEGEGVPSNNVESSVENIAESLEKSLINE